LFFIKKIVKLVNKKSGAEMKRIFTIFILLFVQIFAANSQYWKEIKSIPPNYITNYWLDVFFHPSNSNYGWVCGFQGMVLRTTDGGNNWLGSQVSGATHLEHIHFPTLTTGYTSGPDGIFKSTNGGLTWSNVTPNPSADYWGCYFIDANIGIVLSGGCVDTQKFYRTINGGATWTLFTGNEANSGLTDLILYSPNGLGYAVSSGKLWTTTDGGSTWAVFATSGTNVWQEELTNIGDSFLLPYAGLNCSGQGQDGGMRFTTDKGLTWNNYQTFEAMFGSYLISETKGWACGDGRGVFYTSDGGVNWKLRNCGIAEDANLDDIWFINENSGFVVGHGVYKLSPAEYEVTKDTLLFDNLCVNQNKIDSLIVNCKSFDDTNVELAITNDVGGHFRLVSPNPSFLVLQCGSKVVTVGFYPLDDKSHTARLRVVFNPGTTNEVIKFVELIGNVRKPSAFPQDTLIVLNSVNCNIWRQVNIPWFADQKGESISDVNILQKSGGISLSTPIPLILNVPVTNSSFIIQLPDTGWHQARYRFTMSPCSRDTFITIRAYGVSPIISHTAKKQLNSTCLNQVFDTIRVFNTGNDILKIGQVKFDPVIPEFTIVGWINTTTPVSIIQKSYADLIISYFPKSHGVHLTKLTIENNDSTKIFGNKNLYNIDLHGVSSSVVLTDTIKVDFGNICLGEQKLLTTKIYNTGNLDAALSIMDKVDNLSVTLSDINSRINKNDSLNINILFTAKDKGIFNKSVRIISNPCGKFTVIIIKANVITNELEIIPSKISGIVKLGQSLQKSIRINSLSDVNINIKKISIEPANPDWNYSFTPAVPMLLLPKQGADFNFTFTPLTANKLQGKIVIETDGPCPQTYYVDLDLSSFSRFVEISPDKIDFGKFICNYDEQFADITITNKGFSADTVNEISFDAPSAIFDITNMPTLPLILQAEEIFILKVRMKKQNSEGIFTSKITVKTIGSDGQTFEIPISAEFRKSNITPTYKQISFGNFEICSNIGNSKFDVTNNGTLADTLVMISNSNDKYFIVKTVSVALKPNETKIIEIDFDPLFVTQLGMINSKIVFESTVCKTILNIDADANLVTPDISIQPKVVSFGDKWVEDIIKKSVKITNNGVVNIKIDKVELSDNLNFEILNNPEGKRVNIGSFLDFDVNYIGKTAGNHFAEILIKYSSDCNDSMNVSLDGSVRDEKYEALVYIDRYEAVAGDNIDIFLKLKSGIDRVEPTRIDFEITFDKNLFYPAKVESIFGSTYADLTYTYSNGIISGFIQNEFAKDILKNSGNLLRIQGLVLLSIPDSTTLKISKFEVTSDKFVDITKNDGFLKLIDYCPRTTEISQFVTMPRFKINSGNVAKNGFYNFSINSTSDIDVEMQITDINGITQDLAEIKSNTEKTEHNIDLQNFSNGVYFVYFKSKYQKLMVQIINIK
jgi:photosystem II stability/assembly factor-like uncharacterized protein